MPVKLSQKHREAVIVRAGIDIVHNHGGIANLTFDKVAELAIPETSRHTVKHWFGTRDALWAAVIKADTSGRAMMSAQLLGWSDDD